MLTENPVLISGPIGARFVTSHHQVRYRNLKPPVHIYAENGLHSKVGNISCPAVHLVKWKIFVYIVDFFLLGRRGMSHFKGFNLVIYTFL